MKMANRQWMGLLDLAGVSEVGKMVVNRIVEDLRKS